MKTIRGDALATDNYALQTIFRANIDSDPEDAIKAERKWQTERLLELPQEESMDIIKNK